MRKTEQERIRKQLLDQRREIEQEVVSHEGVKGGESNAEFRDLEDRAAGLSDALLNGTIAGRDMNLLEKIDLALQRLEDGTYEQCAACGEKIPLERLRAKPSASLCVGCQAAKEP